MIKINYVSAAMTLLAADEIAGHDNLVVEKED